MRDRAGRSLAAPLLAGLLALAGGPTALAQQQAQTAPTGTMTATDGAEVFRARVFRPGGRANSMSSVTFTVNRWTTLDEREELVGILETDGADAMSAAIRQYDVGFARAPDNPGWRLNYALSLDTQQGRLIRLVAERPLVLGELARQDVKNRNERQFAVAEFILDDKGEGKGTIIPVAAVDVKEDGHLQIRAVGVQPYEIRSVEKRK